MYNNGLIVALITFRQINRHGIIDGTSFIFSRARLVHEWLAENIAFEGPTDCVCRQVTEKSTYFLFQVEEYRCDNEHLGM